MALGRVDAERQNEPREWPPRSLTAFRVDDRRVIATLAVNEPIGRQRRDLPTEPVVARYGFAFFEPPEGWLRRAAEVSAGDRWLLQLGPGRMIVVGVERLVGGYAGCLEHTGVLLRVPDSEAAMFAALPAKYFLAARAEPGKPPSAVPTAVGPVKSPATADFRRALEAMLAELLARELPGVRASTAERLQRAAPSDVGYHRTWARQQLAVEDAMTRGRGALTYDVQSFRLSPDDERIHFVRAEWLVGQRQGFAASLWVRGEGPIELIAVDLKPASWLRSFKFQGRVSRSQIGLVLNVFDTDRDGWGEVLLSQDGYEGRTLWLTSYTRDGLRRSGLELSSGC